MKDADKTYVMEIKKGLWVNGKPRSLEQWQAMVRNGGIASLINQPSDDETSNVRFKVGRNSSVGLESLQAIQPGEELLVFYNRGKPSIH